MGTETGINYVDHTWNPWQGCPGHDNRPACDNCYMVRDRTRYGHSEEDCRSVKRSKPGTFNQPIAHDRKDLYKWKSGARVFVCSWSDFFLPEADEWRANAWQIMYERFDLTFIIPTKQIERVKDCLPDDWGGAYPNVWLMPTVENQEVADKVIPILLTLPFWAKGISAEPLLGPLDFLNKTVEWENGISLVSDQIDFIVTGGESGKNARPSHPDWFRTLRDQCAETDTAFNFKQWGEWIHCEAWPNDRNGEVKDIHQWAGEKKGEGNMYLVGKHKASRLLDGREHNEMPELGG